MRLVGNSEPALPCTSSQFRAYGTVQASWVWQMASFA